VSYLNEATGELLLSENSFGRMNSLKKLLRELRATFQFKKSGKTAGTMPSYEVAF
jgi:hypothetical protein